MSKMLKADLSLLFVALTWGLSYYLVDIVMEDLGVYGQNAYRFFIAFGFALVLGRGRLAPLKGDVLKHSFIMGAILSCVYFGSTMGVKYTSLSNTAFLCSLMVIFTPLFATLYYGKAPSKKTIFCVIVSFIGIAFLTLGEDFKIQMSTLKGDLVSILAAVAYANHLLYTERTVRKSPQDAFSLSAYQFLFVGLINLVLMVIFEKPGLPSTGMNWFALIFLSVFCTGLAFILQTLAQRDTPASHVGVIFSLEPVFASIFAYILLGEVLLPRAYFGAFLMLASVILMELPGKKERLKTPNQDGEEKTV